MPGAAGGLCFSVELHRFTGPDPDIARDAAEEILAESWVGGSIPSTLFHRDPSSNQLLTRARACAQPWVLARPSPSTRWRARSRQTRPKSPP